MAALVPVYLFTGEDRYTKNEAIEKAKKALLPKDGEAFNFFMPTLNANPYTYVGEYVGTGDASTTVFNLPCRTSASVRGYGNCR